LENPADDDALRLSLAENLNTLLDDPSLYDLQRFEHVTLSRQSRRFIDKEIQTQEDQIVFNRSLLEDAYADEMSRQPNYRISYLLSSVIALIGALVTMTTRKGRYSETIRDGSG